MPTGTLQSGWEAMDVSALLDELGFPALRAAIILDVAPLTVERWKQRGKIRTKDVAKLREAAHAAARRAVTQGGATLTFVFKSGATERFVSEWAESFAQEYHLYLREVQYTVVGKSASIPVRP